MLQHVTTWYNVLQHGTTCYNMLLRTVPLPPGLQQDLWGPTPSAARAGGAITSWWRFPAMSLLVSKCIRREMPFSFHLNLWCFLAFPSGSELTWKFLVSDDVIQHDFSLIYLELPILRCTLITSAMGEGIPGSMRPSSHFCHSLSWLMRADLFTMLATCVLCVCVAFASQDDHDSEYSLHVDLPKIWTTTCSYHSGSLQVNYIFSEMLFWIHVSWCMMCV